MNINELKLEVHDSFKKDEKRTTDFEHNIIEDVKNKAYLDQMFLKKDGHLSLLVRDYNEDKSQYNKQSVEEILFQRVVKTTIQIL